ncbi:MAG: Gfo/Idh/MocA family oxidoreductase [Candidatus Poribacteria bacterium]|nr:Gfo/Idh/MocA family oxidoreductase [Candidatus Poribacteria bacterium]
MSSIRTYGVGMIGFGFIGKMHSLAHVCLPYYYKPLGFETRLVGVATSRGETAVEATAQGGFEFGTTDAQELIDHPDIDVIHVCTPNDTHLKYAVAALNAGKHVYCEKPLARTLDEAIEMASVAEGSGRTHQLAFQYRFVPALIEAKRLIEGGLLGDPLSFRVNYLHSGYVDPNRPLSWRTDAAKSGGGALHDLGSHAVDLLRHLLGDVKRVSATLPTFVKERPTSGGKMAPVLVDDLALLQIEMANGAFGTVEASRIATGTTDDLNIELHGTGGAITFKLMEPNWLCVFDAKSPHKGFTQVQTMQTYAEPAVFPSPKAGVGWTRFHVASLYDFMANVAAERAGSPSFQDGAAVQGVLEAAQRSAESGGWVDVRSF